MCSADVASALAMAGVLDYTPALNANLRLTIPVTPSQVHCLVSSAYTSILTLQTTLLTSITLLVIRVLPLMTLDSSIVLMFPSRWFVPLERTPSILKIGSRLATVWLLTPSHKEPQLALVLLPPMLTATTVAFLSRTSCDPLFTRLYERVFGPSFFI